VEGGDDEQMCCDALPQAKEALGDSTGNNQPKLQKPFIENNLPSPRSSDVASSWVTLFLGVACVCFCVVLGINSVAFSVMTRKLDALNKEVDTIGQKMASISLPSSVEVVKTAHHEDLSTDLVPVAREHRIETEAPEVVIELDALSLLASNEQPDSLASVVALDVLPPKSDGNADSILSGLYVQNVVKVANVQKENQEAPAAAGFFRICAADCRPSLCTASSRAVPPETMVFDPQKVETEADERTAEVLSRV
jgi:hypothetical protein